MPSSRALVLLLTALTGCSTWAGVEPASGTWQFESVQWLGERCEGDHRLDNARVDLQVGDRGVQLSTHEEGGTLPYSWCQAQTFGYSCSGVEASRSRLDDPTAVHHTRTSLDARFPTPDTALILTRVETWCEGPGCPQPSAEAPSPQGERCVSWGQVTGARLE